MKKIISTIAAAALLVGTVPLISASAEDVTACEFVLTPDKEFVHPGETVTYTFSIIPNGDVYALQAFLELPEGFTLVENSGKLIDGVKEQLKWDDLDVTQSNKLLFSGFTALNPYTKAEELKIATFTCTAETAGSPSLSSFYVLNKSMTNPAELTTNFLPVKLPGLKKVEANASTCKERGNNEYYVCEDNCGRAYKDAERKTETTPDKELLPLSEHKYTSETISSEYLKSEANCKTPAVYYKRCVNCGEKSAETFTHGEKDPAKHTGNTELKNQKDATCKEPGYSGDTYCKDCGEKISSGKVLTVAHKGGKATCAKKAVCEQCGEEYGELDPKNHGELELRNAVKATESQEGYTGDKHCKDCQALVEKGTVIPKLKPTNPDTPDTPDTPSTPDKPDTPSNPDKPDTPSTPDKPDTPSTPDKPDTPSTPDKPDTPSTPNKPDTPSTPNKPDTPSNPDKPDTSSTLSKNKGSVFVESKLGENVPKMEIATSPDILSEILLTDDEKELFKNGYNVTVTLTADNIGDSISDSDKALVSDTLTALGDHSFGEYYDIGLFKVISGKRNRILAVGKPITVTAEIPAHLLRANREYKLIRIHDGKASILNDLDHVSNTVTFESDRFSVYALVYCDKAADGDIPYTGVVSPLPILAATGAAALLVCIVLFFTTGKNGLSEEKKERVFTELIAWGKRGGKVRGVIALALISVLLVYYYGIGMKTADRK